MVHLALPFLLLRLPPTKPDTKQPIGWRHWDLDLPRAQNTLHAVCSSVPGKLLLTLMVLPLSPLFRYVATPRWTDSTQGAPPRRNIGPKPRPLRHRALGLSLTSFSPSSSSILFHVRCEPTASYQTHGEAPQINSERLPSVIAEGYTRSDLTGSPGEYYYVPTFYTPSEPFVPVDPMQMSVDSHNPFHPFVSSEFSDVFSVPLDPDTFAALAASGMLAPPHSQPLRRTLEPIHQPYPVYPSLPTSPHIVDDQYPSKLPTYSHTNYNSGSQTKPTEMIMR